MNSNWLINENKAKVILFFNGWGQDDSAVAHLTSTQYDVLTFNNYKQINSFEEDILSYGEIYLVAWSLGVWNAAAMLAENPEKLQKAIAINGTLNPIDEEQGIHPAIYNGTLSGWNEKNRERFLLRIIGDRKLFAQNRSKFGSRSVLDQQEELQAIANNFKKRGAAKFYYDTAIIGTEDAIFAKQNQVNHWQNKSQYKLVDMPHYPFLHFKTWDEIVNLK